MRNNNFTKIKFYNNKDMVYSRLMADLELLSISLINDMYAESRNDDCKYAELATQEDF